MSQGGTSKEYQQHIFMRNKKKMFVWIPLLSGALSKSLNINHLFDGLVLMARLDACPTGDLEVVGPITTGSATFFNGDWSQNIVYGHSVPSADVVSFWQKNVHDTD